jgi:multidrug efflux pump subunit AcrA (membrane-fusion protein)
MWIRVPGRIRSFLTWGGFLALALMILAPGPAFSANPGEAPAPVAPPPAPSPEAEIVFNGKLFTSLKRLVDLPFKGIITTLLVKSGQRVEAGDVLAQYRLTPEALLAIRQRLFPTQVTETEIRLAEVERSLGPLKSKRQELTQLVRQKLAPPESLADVNRDLQLLTRQQTTLRDRLGQERRTLELDQTLLKAQLGDSLKGGQVPQEAALRAPIAGYVTWISPEVRPGAELPPTPGVFQVGVMDPMLVRAQAFEIEALQIHPGEAAEVTLESLPGRKFQAQVSRVSWSSLTPGLDQPSYYDVELKVPNPDLVLKEGLKARIVFKKSP